MKKIIYIFLLFSYSPLFPQEKDTLSLLFVGDIMGHSPQIHSAYNNQTGRYEYDPVFAKVAPIFKENDFVIANLEVTLGGKPYTGYPTFSSPNALAAACYNSGINVMVTANNHSCDRGLKGITNTLYQLDSLGIRHTGTFYDLMDRARRNLLVLEKNRIRIGILNYTYGTNGLPIPNPTQVNLLDTLQIKNDIYHAQKLNLDKLITVVHWGIEYANKPNKAQKDMADFLFKNGVDIIIGGHPHVLQPMEIRPCKAPYSDQFITYSIGNFISNQRKRHTDGGVMVKLTLIKNQHKQTYFSAPKYYLTWVHIYNKEGKAHYEILPCTQVEKENFKGMSLEAIKQMKIFIEDSRKLFKENNSGDIFEKK
ncbi:CapA family protein [Capnocytophaga sp. oral taxon 338]|uniref:CapA family protein n=1 Tax=Capnocytophaga sp. oral taxon 338 TaxID=710239 RepID=UPI000202E507|nr:CapA family protein [Capnocytophaga sp. oral taxon 338]EGD33059.1 capsule biosynthesis protein CapA [Capnocytophaga sp. oral taxon 338 str. F0234]